MKPILIISFLILFKLSYCQLLLNNPNYYVYNDSKDTIYLSKITFRGFETFLNKRLNSTQTDDTRVSLSAFIDDILLSKY